MLEDSCEGIIPYLLTLEADSLVCTTCSNSEISLVHRSCRTGSNTLPCGTLVVSIRKFYKVVIFSVIGSKPGAYYKWLRGI